MKKPVVARYVKFIAKSYYGKGAGLNYIGWVARGKKSRSFGKEIDMLFAKSPAPCLVCMICCLKMSLPSMCGHWALKWPCLEIKTNLILLIFQDEDLVSQGLSQNADSDVDLVATETAATEFFQRLSRMTTRTLHRDVLVIVLERATVTPEFSTQESASVAEDCLGVPSASMVEDVT